MDEIEIYTDGGCHGNPGPGGWAFVAVSSDAVTERSGGEPATTNNRMELEAVIQALRFAATSGHAGHVKVVTDSQYVKNGITSWIKTWMKNGWQTSNKRPVKNREYWIRLHELDALVRPEWAWVKGHSGNPQNERCDALVQDEIARFE